MEDPPPSNPYKTLGVSKDATLATIRSAYRKLVLSCHPDKVQEEAAKKVKAEQFHQVQQAYEILSDERRRQRYDEKVKLDELRAEMANDRGPPLSRRTTDFEYRPSRGGPPPRREMRENVIFETREPRNARYSDEDYPTPRYETRSSPRNYDDYHHTSSIRRPPGRPYEERKKTRDMDDDRDRRRRERDEEAYQREQRTKRRDKDKKRNTETKPKRQFSAHYDSASDSEVDDRHYTSKREPPARPRYEEIPMRSREDVRRNGKAEQGYDDDDDGLGFKMSWAQDYMKGNTRESVEVEPRHLGRSRAASNLEPQIPPPPPPVDTSKRSSARRGHSSRQASPVRPSRKDKRSPEIVDPPSTRKPSMPGATSDPRGIKKGFMSSSRKEPQRSATFQPSPHYKQPPIRRSETAPLNRLQRDEFPRSSPLKNTKVHSDSESSDSDSDTPAEAAPPARPSLRQKLTSYRVRDDEKDYVVEPKDTSPPRARESSPNARRSTNRPNIAPRGSSTQTPPMPRAGSYAFPQDERLPRPGFSRTESARPTPTKSHQSSRAGRLFGEQTIPEDDYGTRRSLDTYPEERSRYPKQFSRRGSEDLDPDAYPGSNFRRNRPHLERHGTYAY